MLDPLYAILGGPIFLSLLQKKSNIVKEMLISGNVNEKNMEKKKRPGGREKMEYFFLVVQIWKRNRINIQQTLFNKQ